MKRLNLILLILGMATCVWAERVDLSTARRVAEQVTSQSALRSAGNSTLKLAYEAPALSDNGLRSATGETDYYVFNVGDGDGFVIVSGEDRAHPVLGYSTSGRFVADSLPSNAAAWLEGYQREIAHLVKMEAEAPASVREEWENYLAGSVRTNGGRLLKTANWNQDAPYNWQTPVVNGRHTLTCCVATATAILLKYHEAPQKPLKTGSEEVMLRVGVTNEGAVESGPYTVDYSGDYDWDNMLDQYDGYYTKDQGDAVAKLMWHIGANLNVAYAFDVSTAYTPRAEWVLREVFGCKAAHIEQKYFYSWEEWKTLLREEIDNDRPFLMSATNSDAPVGHAFVCDGYDATGLFHINWGWGGSMNGYFQASTLDPYGGDVSNQFNAQQDVIIGIDPNGEEMAEVDYEPAGCIDVEEGADQAEAPVVGESYEVSTVIINRGLESMTALFGLAVLDLETMELTSDPTNPIEVTVEPRTADVSFMTAVMNLSITLKEEMAEAEVIVPCYQDEDGDWVPVTPLSGAAFGIAGDGQYVSYDDDEPDDPEATYYPFFQQNALDKRYLSRDINELPVFIALRQVADEWPTVKIRYRLGSDALELMNKGWKLYGREATPMANEGEYKQFEPKDSVEFIVAPEDYLYNNPAYNQAVCSQVFKLVWPEESTGEKPTGTFSYEVAIFDAESDNRLDEPGSLTGSVEIIGKPLVWHMSVSNIVEDEAERLKSYDATFTLLMADEALKTGGETELFAYLTGGQATVIDEAGTKHDMIDEGNGRYRIDNLSLELVDEASLTLHVDLSDNVQERPLLPSLEMARHDNKLVSTDVSTIDLVSNGLEERYFPTIVVPEEGETTDPNEPVAFDAVVCLSALTPEEDLIFQFKPTKPEDWTGNLKINDPDHAQLVYLDENNEEKLLPWDEENNCFYFEPGDYLMATDEEMGLTDYTIPFRLKATEEGQYDYTIEVWDVANDLLVRCIENQAIRVTYPVKVGQLEKPEGEINTDQKLKFYLKNVGTLLKEKAIEVTLQLNGDLPEESVTLAYGEGNLPFTRPEEGIQAIEASFASAFTTDSMTYESTIRSTVPIEGGVHNPFVLQLHDAEGHRLIPTDGERLSIDLYEDYTLRIQRKNLVLDYLGDAEMSTVQAADTTIQIRSGRNVFLEMTPDEGYRLPSVPALKEIHGQDSLLVGFESGSNYEYALDEEGFAQLWISNPKANYELIVEALKIAEQCEVVSEDPSIRIEDPILDKVSGFQTIEIEVVDGYELPPYVIVTAWRYAPQTGTTALRANANGPWEEIPMAYGQDYTYDRESGEVKIRVKNADMIVITPSDTEPAGPEEPEEPEEPVCYTLTLPQVTGATTEPDFGVHEVMAGESFVFRIILDEDYDESTPIVKANGKLIEPNAQGEYVVPAIDTNTTITIEGIIRNDEGTAIDTVGDVIRVWGADGTLYIHVDRPMPARVVNYVGQVIRSWQAVEGDQAVSLPDGAYIVIVGDRHFKVVL